MPYTHNGTEYHYAMGSDVNRDGMYLEVCDDPKFFHMVFEIFYSDVTDEMTITMSEPNIPIGVVEWALSIAKKRLQPKRGV